MKLDELQAIQQRTQEILALAERLLAAQRRHDWEHARDLCDQIERQNQRITGHARQIAFACEVEASKQVVP